MSNGYRDGAFALSLVVGGGLALNLFLWLDYKAKYEGDQPTSDDSGANSSEIGGFWDQLIGTFVSPSDTLAQWVMAIFTNLEGLSGVHLDEAVYAFDVFESEVFAYGHYAVSWGIGEDRRIEKAAHDMSSVMPGDLFARELRRKERPKKG